METRTPNVTAITISTDFGDSVIPHLGVGGLKLEDILKLHYETKATTN
jgi:hypothetical protein